ncbi:MAG: hypothetical protein JWQ03_2473 [Variovorax sp.]|nr:hypothetical protein [Variovorax sp.]
MNINMFTKLPAPAAAPSELPLGTVRLFRDDNWSSTFLDLTTGRYRDRARHSIAGTNMQDAATYVAFNLPVGTMMTLMDNDVAPKAGTLVMDLSQCGKCIDLVGTGQTEAVDLPKVNMNDCVSSFFWRTVDLRMGALELWDDAHFAGNRNIVFLSEWPSNKVISIQDWWINDRVSSVRWPTMDDRQTVSLYENPDGGGRGYENIQGWGDTQEDQDFSQSNFNDAMSSFKLQGLAPQREIVDPFVLDTSAVLMGAKAVSIRQFGSNDSPVEQSFPVTFKKTNSQTLTITSTDTHVVDTSISMETSASYSAAGASVGMKLTVSLKFSYTHTETTTTSVTESLEFSYTTSVKVPANSRYMATLTVQMGDLPPTQFTTNAVRWYDVPVTSGVRDPANNDWYKRTEKVTGTVSGGLAGLSTASIMTDPPHALPPDPSAG